MKVKLEIRDFSKMSQEEQKEQLEFLIFKMNKLGNDINITIKFEEIAILFLEIKQLVELVDGDKLWNKTL